MEGVMMRAPHSYCVAVRKPDGEIVTEEMPLARMSELYPIFKYPVLRGVGTLYQAMKLGVKALQFSANAALAGCGREPPAKRRPQGDTGLGHGGRTCCFRWLSFIFMYKFLPLYLATRLESVFPALHGRLAFNFADGLIRMAIFLGFLWTISRFQRYPPPVRIPRRRAQSGLQFRIRPAGDGGERAALHHLPPALRHQLPDAADVRLAAGLSRSSRSTASRPSSSARIALLPLIIGRELRADPLRRQPARLVPGGSHGARPVAPAHHHASRPTTTRPRWPSTRSKAPWRSKNRRAANWSSPNPHAIRAEARAARKALRRAYTTDGRSGRDRRCRTTTARSPRRHSETRRGRRQVPRVEAGGEPALRRLAAMLQESDPDLRAMAEEEVARLTPELALSRGRAQGPAAAQRSQRR